MAVKVEANSPKELSRLEFEYESLTVQGLIDALQKVQDKTFKVNVALEGWPTPCTCLREMDNKFVILE